MSPTGEPRGFVGSVDRLADVAIQTFSTLARRAARVTLGLAAVALAVTGPMLLVALAAFPADRATMAVVGGLVLAGAVGPPLLAAWRLYAVPRAAGHLGAELRTLVGRSDDARRIVVDTVAYEERPGEPGAGSDPSLPALVVRTQQYGRLRSVAAQSGEFVTLAATLRVLTTLPFLLITGVALTLLGALLGFVFLLVWIF